MRTAALALATLLAGCSPWDADTPLSDCDPLDTALCALPFPSAFFLAPDADTETGWRVDFCETSLPLNVDGVQLDPRFLNEKDGFSINSPVLVYFDDVSLDGTVSHDDIGGHEADDARTVLIDTSTGERVPHFVELDGTAPSDDEALLVLRPVVPLAFDTRYVVGIRGLSRKSGGDVRVSAGFATLRDGTRAESWDVESRRDAYEDVIFPALDAQGFERDDLQLAWDFHTASRQSTIGRAEWIRDDALERMGASGPAYTIDSIDEGDCDGGTIARTIHGTLAAPLYTDVDEPATFLTRDGDGWPYHNGESSAEFIVRVPCSVAAAAVPAPILQYGHGLLGSLDEAKTGWLASFADANGYIVLATSWKGMSEDDRGDILLMSASDPSDFSFVPERSVQGFVEAMAAMRMLTGDLASDAALAFPDDAGTDVSVVDPSRRYYYGNSQGGILGGAYLAFNPDLERGVLGVSGMPYALLLPRSSDFIPYFLIFKQKFDDHRQTMLIVMGLLQQVWDIGETAGYAHDLREHKQALIQVAIGDAQVTTLGAHVQARGVGASLVAPATRPVWGLAEKQPGFTGSALVEFAYDDVPAEPFDSVPPEVATDPHECPRRDPDGQAQVATFLETGVVEHTCDGPCTGRIQATCR